MLFESDNLLPELSKVLLQAQRVEIAVAWVNNCSALEQLCEFAERAGKLKVIVGIWGNATHPAALRKLQRAAELRIVTGTNSLFHPKLYLFHKATECEGWIGSANLTNGGFELNEELVMKFTDKGDAAGWFSKLWNSLENSEGQATIIDEYENGWKPPAPPPLSKKAYHKAFPFSGLYDLAGGITSWSSFESAIDEADEYWGNHWDIEHPVTGEVGSWCHTISQGHAVIVQQSWDDLSKTERHLLLGRGDYHGLLGSMKGAGVANNIFAEKSRANIAVRATIRRHLQLVIDSSDADFAGAAVEFISELNSIDGFGGALATRFLALARPDRAVSVNAGSRRLLAELSGLPPTALSNAPNGRGKTYLDLLRWFEEQSWYSNPMPQDNRGRMLASYRAAIFDALVYKEQ
ncbi:NgoFVII family restriction endonuclease [Tardiphaga sp. vice304]|uniref:phospholipase D-like domain-containing protein n=1 Tax=Tardiphaga sp. vice304 TaxID=2592817 RepID=UPI001163C833|nr:phospholipase D-like domain-containing protein [Tardiphaga sp. vice304]QDM28417.1 NgoFVII family restriction endonuclease [Tardiphaga sp. vice304]